jgi:flagellar protein FliO/FliZ
LGGEELKLPVFALLFFGAGLLVQIPSISAQEDPPQEIHPLRAAERAIILDEENAPAPAIPNRGPSTWAMIRMLLTLALAAAAIYGVVFFIRRSSKQPVEGDPFLKILATAHLGSNRYAHIVNVGDKAWLLGSSDGGVNLISEIENKDMLNAMLVEDSRKSAQARNSRFPDFLSVLRRMGVQPQERVPGVEDIRKRRERLKGL